MNLFLDTHVVAWLYSNQIDLLSTKSIRAIEESNLFVSPMVGLELQYLFEIGRLNVKSTEILNNLSSQIGLSVSNTDFAELASIATDLSWTRDPFDRIIVAQAVAESAKFLTKDRVILKNYQLAIW